MALLNIYTMVLWNQTIQNTMNDAY